VKIAGLQLHRLAELLTGRFRLPGFQQCVSQVLADVRTAWRKSHGLLKQGDCAVVIPQAQGFERLRQRRVSGIYFGDVGGAGYLRWRRGREQEKHGQ
jgi:hypothetical protein